MHACPYNCLCVLATVWTRRRCRRSHWLLKVALLRQARPFNQVPHIRQLCPHSKQPLCLAGELQHPAGGGRGQLALGDQPKLLPLPRQGEVAFVCLFGRQTEIERLQETLRSAAEKGRRQKSEVVNVSECVSLHTFECVVCVCVRL